MHALFRHSLMAVIFLVAITSLATADTDYPETGQDLQPERPVDTGLTGSISEEQFMALHDLTTEKAPAPKGEMIDLAGGRAYLSLPEKAQAPLPGIVVIHEWWGLNDHIKHWADRLAAEGYAALAVDLYGGKVATESEYQTAREI